MKDFSNKTVIVTGASRGIGLATATYFWSKGAKVTFAVRDTENTQISQEIKNSKRCLLLKVDVLNEDDIKAMVEKTLSRFNSIDILVNNAGVDQPCFVDEITREHWNYIMDTNVTGLIFCTKQVVKQMKKQKSGVIINLSSIAGKEGFKAHSAYVASKHAVIGITKCLAIELIEYNIRVNAVCPGLIETDMLKGFFKDYAKLIKSDPEKELNEMIAKTPRKQMGKPKDVANLIGFLASDEAENIIGHAINTDGGILQH